jgi:hypothetical protein
MVEWTIRMLFAPAVYIVWSVSRHVVAVGLLTF